MKLIKLLFLCGVIISQYVHSQSSQEELSKEAANPLADLMSFPFQNNLNMNYGPYNRNMNVLNIQPVLPFAGGQIIISAPSLPADLAALSSALISLTAAFRPFIFQFPMIIVLGGLVAVPVVVCLAILGL